MCANAAFLWKRHAYILGENEGVGNIAKVMETVVHHYRHSLDYGRGAEQPLVDWKRAYRDLLKLVIQMKKLVFKNVDEEGKRTLDERLKLAAKDHAAASINLSLMEMLEMRKKGRIMIKIAV